MADPTYPRDLAGYRGATPDPLWPGGARLAVQFALHLEAGAENSILHGDPTSEDYLSEIVDATPLVGIRSMPVESAFEYGSRAGIWRVFDLFQSRGLPLTLFAVAAAAVHTPWIVDRALRDGHEVACHGLRWIDYARVSEDVERSHVSVATKILTRLCGQAPVGWYTGRSSVNTRRLVAAHGGYLYDSDDFSDDLPFWSRVETGQLIIPQSLDANDMRFGTARGLDTGDQFFACLRDSFDTLHAEGARAPKMLSIGLHARLIGRPSRIAGLQRFIDHMLGHDGVWVARRVEIAEHWRRVHPSPVRP